jgi:hypothetical protein
MEESKKGFKSTDSAFGTKTEFQACSMSNEYDKLISTDSLDNKQHDFALETFNCCQKIYEVACENKSLMERLT